MSRSLFLHFLLIVLLLPTFTLAKKDDPVIAKLDGKDIMVSDIQPELKHITKDNDVQFTDLPQELQAAILKSVLGKKILDEEIEKSKFSEREDIQEQLEYLKEEYIRREYIARKIKRQVSKRKIKQHYKKSNKKYKNVKEAAFMHILAKSQDDVSAVSEMLQECKKFEKTITKNKNFTVKTVGYTQKGKFSKKLDKAVFSLKKNEISKPFETEEGWNIVQLEDKRSVKVPTFKEKEKKITHEITKKAVDKYIAKLLKKHKLEIMLEKNDK